jgi:hypothetical protein
LNPGAPPFTEAHVVPFWAGYNFERALPGTPDVMSMCLPPNVVSFAYQASSDPYVSSRFVKLGNIFFRKSLSLKSHAASFSYSIW